MDTEMQKMEMEMEMKMKISLTSLPDDIWQTIGVKLEAADRIRFRAVCKLWMSLIPRQPPWLMLADSDQEPEPNAEYDKPIHMRPPFVEEQEDETVVPPPRGFVCVGEQQIYQIDFPEIHRAAAVGSTGNWLITAHRDRTIRLINPFSRQQLYLPSQLAFENALYNTCYIFRLLHLWKVILSSSPSKGRDCIAMASHHFRRTLAIARLGDPKWTTVQILIGCDYRPLSGIQDMVFYKGRFYATDLAAHLFAIDIGDGLKPPPRASLLMESSNLIGDFRKTKNYWFNYLVEWLDELVLATKCLEEPLDNDHTHRTSKFELYKFDFVNRKWNELKSLGEHSLFLGFNTSVSLCASDYFGLIQKNCIYFTDDYIPGYRGRCRKGGHDMGVFDLGDNSIRPHFKGLSTSFYTPPLWIVPT